jgi:predicted phosphate transport protein (TIGR00153 family)
MRIPFFSMFMTSPFEGLQEHSEKVKECGWAFQQAIECHLADKCQTFEEFREEVIRLESEADVIKRRIRGHLPKGTLMPVYNFLLFRYLREQDAVIDAVEDALDWISFRSEPGIPPELEKEFVALADAVLDPIEELSKMVAEARKYFKNYSEDQRVVIKNIIRTLRRQEHEADKAEDMVKQKVLNMNIDAVTVFHMVRLAETIGSIADHAENAGDMMRAMIAR